MEIQKSDFAYVSRFIRDRAAIQLGEDKMYLLDARLGPVCRQHEFRHIPELIGVLRQGRNRQLEVDVIDALTTNETLWYRDGHPWNALRDTILPDLRRIATSSQELRIWCGASSTGQEPYSLAMMILEQFPELLQWNFRFVATDLSTRVLERARAGVYTTMELNRGLPDELRNRYFVQEEPNRWRISERLRSMVQFEQLNLMDHFHHLGQLDLVMLRNVLIYFSAADKESILTKILSRLKPHGYLMLGSSEAALDLPAKLVTERLDRTVVFRTPHALRKAV